MSPARRILFVAPRFAADGAVGGAETLLRRLAERAQAAGREVLFLTTCAQSHFTWENSLPPGRRLNGALPVEYFPVDAGRDLATFHRVQAAISRGAGVSAADEALWHRHGVRSTALCDFLRGPGAAYDAVITGPYLFGLVRDVVQIWPEKTWLVPCLHDEPYAYLELTRSLFAQAGGCLFNTPPEAELAQRLFPALPPARCAVVGMGLEPFTADATAFARRHGLDAPYVLYCGRRESGKGTPLLCDYLHAFRQRTGRDVRLVFTGSGPIEAPADLAPAILDVGFVSEQEKHEALAGAAVFCHPSLNESLSIVLLEAWLAGTPALVHARSPVLQWQCRQSGGGLWFRYYPEFEAALERLLAQPTLRHTLGAAGRRYVQTAYAWPAVEQRLFHALDQPQWKGIG